VTAYIMTCLMMIASNGGTGVLTMWLYVRYFFDISRSQTCATFSHVQIW